MPLALEVGGVLAGLWMLTSLIRAHAPDFDAFTVAAVAVPAVLGTLIVGNLLWPAISGLVQDARTDAHVTSAQAAVAGSTTAGADPGFLGWVASIVPEHATYYMIAPPNPALWALFQLLPRRAVSSPRDADWLVFYDAPRSAAGPDGRYFGREITTAPELGVARRG